MEAIETIDRQAQRCCSIMKTNQCAPCVFARIYRIQFQFHYILLLSTILL